MNRAVFLDRDGVLNVCVIKDRKPHPPLELKDFKLVEGVSEGLQELKSAGFKLIVVTNQPDVVRGKQKKETIEDMHRTLMQLLPSLDEIRVCYHTDEENCLCRKPKPGMLTDAAKKWSIDLSKSFIIGDRWRDVEAGQAVGCKTVFMDYNYNEKRPTNMNATVKSFKEATAYILGEPS